MSNTPVKIALAFFVVLSAPAASFARMAGEAGMGNGAMNGIAPGMAKAGGRNNVDGERRGQRFQDSSAAAAAHNCPGRSALQVRPRGLAIFARPCRRTAAHVIQL